MIQGRWHSSERSRLLARGPELAGDLALMVPRFLAQTLPGDRAQALFEDLALEYVDAGAEGKAVSEYFIVLVYYLSCTTGLSTPSRTRVAGLLGTAFLGSVQRHDSSH